MRAAQRTMRQTMRQAPVSEVERETIRAVFLHNGFTIKEGQTDLKPYVYAAAEELLSIARASWQRAKSAGVPVQKLIEGLDEITALSRHLRQGGCDSTDLPGLEEGLTHAIDMAAEMLSMLAAPAQPAAQDQGEVQRLRGALEWAVDRWHAEVASRPLVNVHRRALDDTWRQIIRRLGGDAGLPCGPAHDELLALAASTGQEVKP